MAVAIKLKRNREKVEKHVLDLKNMMTLAIHPFACRRTLLH